MLFDYLIQNYNQNEPIFLPDIQVEGMSDENIRYHLKRLTEIQKLFRFEPGVYYLPKESELGGMTALTVEEVALHKYVCRKGKRVGFYSGYTLANRLGLSTQVPFVEEITSNYAPAPVREISIKNRKYILRRPVVEVTDENVFVLQFLDCLRDLDQSAEESMEQCGRILSNYAREHEITKEKANQYLNYYPLKIYKAIYETGVEYVSARG